MRLQDSDIDALRMALSGFNLNDAEIKVYATALSLGPRPASKIAKHSGLNRPYTYDVLSALSSKGLVQEVLRNQVKQFRVEPPEQLVAVLESRQEELRAKKERLISSIPVFQKLQKHASPRAALEQFTGFDGLTKIFEMALAEDGEEIFMFGTFGVVDTPNAAIDQEAYRKWCRSFTQKRKKKNISLNAIVSEQCAQGLMASLSPRQLLEIRLVTMPPLPCEVVVFGSKVALVSADTRVAYLVEDSKIAALAKNYHEMVWNSRLTEQEIPKSASEQSSSGPILSDESCNATH